MRLGLVLSFLGFCPNEIIRDAKYLCVKIFIIVILIVEDWKQLKCPTEEHLNTLWICSAATEAHFLMKIRKCLRADVNCE